MAQHMRPNSLKVSIGCRGGAKKSCVGWPIGPLSKNHKFCEIGGPRRSRKICKFLLSIRSREPDFPNCRVGKQGIVSSARGCDLARRVDSGRADPSWGSTRPAKMRHNTPSVHTRE